MRFLIKFSYDGTNYSGYQTQKGLTTIQDEMEKALKKINNGKEIHKDDKRTLSSICIRENFTCFTESNKNH